MDNLIEKVTYKNHVIEIHLDTCALNPWENEDGLNPVAVYNDRSIRCYGDIDIDSLPDLTRQQIIDNKTDILALIDNGYTFAQVYQNEKGYFNFRFDDAVHMVNELLQLKYNGEFDSQKLQFYSEVLTIAGIENYQSTSQGYSQGDWAEVLVIGENPECDFDLFTAWAWGDVYYFNIPSLDDSCHGFYGTDHEASGLLDHARSAIDWHISSERKKRTQKLKVMIKNHVALDVRTSLMGGVTK